MKNCEYLGKGISSPLMLGGRYTPRQWSCFHVSFGKFSYYRLYVRNLCQFNNLLQNFLIFMGIFHSTSIALTCVKQSSIHCGGSGMSILYRPGVGTSGCPSPSEAPPTCPGFLHWPPYNFWDTAWARSE